MLLFFPSSAYVEKYLLEKSRLVYQEHNERWVLTGLGSTSLCAAAQAAPNALGAGTASAQDFHAPNAVLQREMRHFPEERATQGEQTPLVQLFFPKCKGSFVTSSSLRYSYSDFREISCFSLSSNSWHFCQCFRFEMDVRGVSLNANGRLPNLNSD